MAQTPWQKFLYRLRQHFLLKCVGTSVFITVFFMAYLWLLKNPQFAVTVMPLTPVDRAIAFEPAALAIYATLWFYVSIPPAFLAVRTELYQYGTAIGMVCAIGLSVFFFWPTAVPPALIDFNAHPGFAFLKSIDAAGNACPSLHVATAVFSGIWLHRMLLEIGASRRSRLINALWCAAIVYSTLATKQHVAVDVAAGTALGWLGAWTALLWRARTHGPAGRA